MLKFQITNFRSRIKGSIRQEISAIERAAHTNVRWGKSTARFLSKFIFLAYWRRKTSRKLAESLAKLCKVRVNIHRAKLTLAAYAVYIRMCSGDSWCARLSNYSKRRDVVSVPLKCETRFANVGASSRPLIILHLDRGYFNRRLIR